MILLIADVLLLIAANILLLLIDRTSAALFMEILLFAAFTLLTLFIFALLATITIYYCFLHYGGLFTFFHVFKAQFFSF